MSINGQSFKKKDWAKVGIAVAALAAPWVVPALAGTTAAAGAAGAAGATGAGSAAAGGAAAGAGGAGMAGIFGPALEHSLATSLLPSTGSGLLGGSALGGGTATTMFGPTAAGAELMGTFAPYANAAATPNPFVSFQDALGRGTTSEKINALNKFTQQLQQGNKQDAPPPMQPMPQRQAQTQTDIEKLLAMMYPIINRS